MKYIISDTKYHRNSWKTDSQGEDEHDGYPNHDSYGEALEELFVN